MKKRITFNMMILKKLSRDMEYKMVFDWDYGDFGYLLFNNGVRHYFSRGDIRVNRIGTHLIAGNKYYTDMFLKKHKHPIIPSDIFFSESYCREHDSDKDITAAIRFAKTMQYPLIVKPNDGLHGKGVQRVENERQLRKTLCQLFKGYDKILVQQFALGDDYRVVIYNGKFISAYRRLPLTIIGDGRSNIQELLDERIAEYHDASRKFVLEIEKIISVLNRQKMTLQSIPEHGVAVRLLDNANLSAGGYAEDVSDIIHDEYKKHAITAANDMGLRLAGVDLMIDGDITKKPKRNKWFYLELNASPGFHNFSELGDKPYKRIEKLYVTILKDIKNKKLGI